VSCMDLGIDSKIALHNIKRLVFITEVESVYCAVRTEFLYNTDTFRLLKVKLLDQVVKEEWTVWP
jgi:hypothetical protein